MRCWAPSTGATVSMIAIAQTEYRGDERTIGSLGETPFNIRSGAPRRPLR